MNFNTDTPLILENILKQVSDEQIGAEIISSSVEILTRRILAKQKVASGAMDRMNEPSISSNEQEIRLSNYHLRVQEIQVLEDELAKVRKIARKFQEKTGTLFSLRNNK